MARNYRLDPRRDPPRPDIVAKDLTRLRIILTLYFTIFINQLDILCAYTPNGTGRSVPRWI